MAGRPVNPPARGWSLTLPPRMWSALDEHLFGDGQEHGAVILAGYTDGPRGPRLLGRELIPAVDGRDYVPGTRGHRALSPEFVRDVAVRAGDQSLAYLAAHNHGDPYDTGTVGFSRTDLASHERGYPALRAITRQLVGGVVLTPRAAAGDLWLPDGNRSELAELVVPGNNVVRRGPRPARSGRAAAGWDRQARLFGDRGQDTLNQLRVAVVGLGGAGSIIVELLARLGVGHLVLVDDDHVDATNLPRLLAADVSDIDTPKLELAARNARRAHPDITLSTLPLRVEHPDARRALTTCDWIFLAADSHSARHWTNEIVHRHLIPGTQVGVKIPVDGASAIGRIHTATRPLTPGEGCLWCNGLINPTTLATDMHPAAERAAAQYLPDVPAASVITLNALAAAEAVNHFMLAMTGLHHHDTDTDAVLHHPRERRRDLQQPRQDTTCLWCTVTGALGLGDA